MIDQIIRILNIGSKRIAGGVWIAFSAIIIAIRVRRIFGNLCDLCCDRCTALLCRSGNCGTDNDVSEIHLADAALHIHSFVACHCQKSFSVNLSDFRIADGFHHTVDCCLHRSLIQFSLCLADTDFRITDIQLKFLDFFFFFGDRLFEFRYGINAITRFKRTITRIVWFIRIVRFIRIIVLRILDIRHFFGNALAGKDPGHIRSIGFACIDRSVDRHGFDISARQRISLSDLQNCIAAFSVFIHTAFFSGTAIGIESKDFVHERCRNLCSFFAEIHIRIFFRSASFIVFRLIIQFLVRLCLCKRRIFRLFFCFWLGFRFCRICRLRGRRRAFRRLAFSLLRCLPAGRSSAVTAIAVSVNDLHIRTCCRGNQ